MKAKVKAAAEARRRGGEGMWRKGSGVNGRCSVPVTVARVVASGHVPDPLDCLNNATQTDNPSCF